MYPLPALSLPFFLAAVGVFLHTSSDRVASTKRGDSFSLSARNIPAPRARPASHEGPKDTTPKSDAHAIANFATSTVASMVFIFFFLSLSLSLASPFSVSFLMRKEGKRGRERGKKKIWERQGFMPLHTSSLVGRFSWARLTVKTRGCAAFPPSIIFFFLAEKKKSMERGDEIPIST